MNLALWILQGLLALAFLAAGGMKLARSKDQISVTMTWAKDFPQAQIKLIGLAEVLGAVGLIVPPLTYILPILTPIAASALFILMAGAFYTHLKLQEGQKGIGAVILGILAVVVAGGRFIILPF